MIARLQIGKLKEHSSYGSATQENRRKANTASVQTKINTGCIATVAENVLPKN